MRQNVLQTLQKPEQSIVFLYYPLVSFKRYFVILLNNGWTTGERESPLVIEQYWSPCFHWCFFFAQEFSQVLASEPRLHCLIWNKGFGLKKKFLCLPQCTIIIRVFHPTNVSNTVSFISRFVLLFDGTTISWCFFSLLSSHNNEWHN